MFCVFFKQKTAYEMRISDWSSDVCSSDLDFPNAPNTIRLPNGTIVRGPDTYNAKGNDLPNAPKLTANLSATYVIPSSIGDISFTGNVYYNDGRFAEVDNRLRDGSYTLVDASVGWKSTDGTYGLRVWGKNLTDSYHYAQVFSQRSEEHTSELQSLMRISYAVFCLKKKKKKK